MGMPFSSARNCSSFSARSSGETGNLTSRNSVSRRYPYMPKCFKKGNAANCSLTEPLAASRKYGIVRREKYSARPAALTTTFTTFGLPYSSGLGDRRGRGGHFRVRQRAGDGVNHGGVNQRFIPLDVHDRIAGAARGHLGDAVRAAGMIRRGHFGPAEILRDLPNARVVRGHDHLGKRLGLLAALDHVLDERLAGNQRQRLPGEPRRTVTRGDNANHFHRASIYPRQAADCTDEKWQTSLQMSSSVSDTDRAHGDVSCRRCLATSAVAALSNAVIRTGIAVR